MRQMAGQGGSLYPIALFVSQVWECCSNVTFITNEMTCQKCQFAQFALIAMKNAFRERRRTLYSRRAN